MPNLLTIVKAIGLVRTHLGQFILDYFLVAKFQTVRWMSGY
ncbi:MAG: hypothetical protein WBA76_13295 [Phormidesmis sp.]